MLASGLAVINLALGTMLVRVGRRTSALILVANGRHVLTDVWTTAGVVLGLVLVAWTGTVVLDPLMAIAVAAWILGTGWRLVRDAIAGLHPHAKELGGVASRRVL